MTTRDDVQWLIREFAGNVPGVVHAVAYAGDGLLLGHSPDLSRDDADRLAAAGSGVTSLVLGIARVINVGGVQSTVVAFDKGFLFTMSGEATASILVLGSPDCDPADITYRLAGVVEKFGEMLARSVPPRQQGVAG